MNIGHMTLAISVTEANREAVLEGLGIMLGAGAVTATAYGGPPPGDQQPGDQQPGDQQAAAGAQPQADAPKAGRRGSRKGAEAQKPDAAADAGAPPAEEKPADPPPASAAGSNPFGDAGTKPADPPPAQDPPKTEQAAGAAPNGLEELNDMLNRFAAKHGVPATRRVITSFGVTRLAELDKSRWSELVAKLTAENGGSAP